MDSQGIISKLLPIAPAALMAAAAIGITYLTYALYRKKGGNRTKTKSQYAAIFLLLGWYRARAIMHRA